MTGAGLRFILMKPTDIYTYNLFDKFFDWGIMLTLGLLLLSHMIYEYIKEESEAQSQSTSYQQAHPLAQQSITDQISQIIAQKETAQ
jgi:hypothetical protein